MKKENILLWGLVLLFAVLMSVPFLVPHTGLLALGPDLVQQFIGKMQTCGGRSG